MSSLGGFRTPSPLLVSIAIQSQSDYRVWVAGYRRLNTKNERPRHRLNRQVLSEAGVETAWNAACFSVGDVSREVKGAR